MCACVYVRAGEQVCVAKTLGVGVIAHLTAHVSAHVTTHRTAHGSAGGSGDADALDTRPFLFTPSLFIPLPLPLSLPPPLPFPLPLPLSLPVPLTLPLRLSRKTQPHAVISKVQRSFVLVAVMSRDCPCRLLSLSHSQSLSHTTKTHPEETWRIAPAELPFWGAGWCYGLA